jgi:hypothetical protein
MQLEGDRPPLVPKPVRHKLMILWNYQNFWKMRACLAKNLNEAPKHNNSFIIQYNAELQIIIIMTAEHNWQK